MFRRLNVICTLLIMSLVLAASADAIVRVAPRWNFTEVYVQGGAPVGSYNGIPTLPFPRGAEFDGSDMWESGLALGVNIGQVRQHRFAYSIGFRFISSDLKTNQFDYTDGNIDYRLTIEPFNMYQYDLDVNFNVFLLPLDRSNISPYVGFGTSAGFTHLDWQSLPGENSANIALNLNFGAELRLGQPGADRNFVSLVSTNGWNIVASDDRPRYLWFGGALKYYFKL